jgi:ABC-type amino acid transport substrate-binding protein
MKPNRLLSLALAMGLVGGLIGANLFGHSSTIRHESAFDRVMRTNTLRCGYYMFKPMSWKDPNTGQMKGMVVDIADEIYHRSGIKLKFTEEVTFGNMFEGLQTGRYDAICTPTWPDGRSARVAQFVIPWFYSGIWPMVRADETRFTRLADLDQPGVKISAQEGNALQILTAHAFPRATPVVVPQNADGTAQEMDVLTRKADAMVGDTNRFIQFNAKNPGKLKLLPLGPLQINPFDMAVAKGETALQNFLSTNVETLMNDGTMDRIIAKYQTNPPTFIPVAKPYQKAPQ